MIKSDLFYSNFDAGFAPALRDQRFKRSRGKASKYLADTRLGTVSIWFKVNAKASAIPHHPGRFWPVVSAPPGVRHPTGFDDGSVSWYQYTTSRAVERVVALNKRVLQKYLAQECFEAEVWRQMKDTLASMVTSLAVTVPEARFPSTSLLYLDEEDARSWGEEMARQAILFVEAFEALPESLHMYMWRVHWDRSATPGGT